MSSCDAEVAGEEQSPQLVEIITPQDMLREFTTVNVAAPMVRYSKLPFREVVSQYETHLTHTPMILAKEFSLSKAARELEFTTNSRERGVFDMVPKTQSLPSFSSCSSPIASTSNSTPPSSPGPRADEEEGDDSSRRDKDAMKCQRSKSKGKGNKGTRRVRGNLIVQFAANDPVELADAAELVKPWVDGIDLNCGCPQSWAYSDGIGSALLRNPNSVRDMIRTTKQRLGWNFPVSVKIRIDSDLSLTQKLIETSIEAGVDWITVHGRTRHESSSKHPVNLEAIRTAVEFTKGQIPVIANGDVFNLEEANRTRTECNVNGVMAARGLLANPALFAGFSETPLEAVSHFMKSAIECGMIYPLFHRHLAYMLENNVLQRRRDRIWFNSLVSHAGVFDFLESIVPPPPPFMPSPHLSSSSSGPIMASSSSPSSSSSSSSPSCASRWGIHSIA